MSSDIDHWYIDAIVFKDRVEETHFISDPARNVRRQQHKKIWEVERFLGRGGFGEVRLEKNKDDGNTRAVKRIATTSVTLTNSECEKELKALLEFSKPKYDPFLFTNLVQAWSQAAVFVDFYGWFKDGPDVFLAMEYISLGDLETNVKANSGKIPESEARGIAEQILSGLEIMHAESFAHRDLKPQNVLVVNGPPQWWVKLADFGLSKRLTETTAFHTKGGTQSYMAPEILNYLNEHEFNDHYTDSVDIWALGCIVYRLITGTVPFPPGKSLMKYCEDRSLFPYDALFDSGIKSDGSKFLRQLLQSQPTDRPSASQALHHPWIVSNTGPDPKASSSCVPIRGVEVLNEINQFTISGIGYNTDTHDGLRSSTSSSDSSFQPLHNQPQTVQISSTVTQSQLATSQFEVTMKQKSGETSWYHKKLSSPYYAKMNLVELMEDHVDRLEGNWSFRYGLRRALQNAIELEKLILQSAQAEESLRRYLNEEAILRIVVDPVSLRLGINRLIRGPEASDVDVRPLTVVLKFLESARVRPMQLTTRTLFLDPLPGLQTVRTTAPSVLRESDLPFYQSERSEQFQPFLVQALSAWDSSQSTSAKYEDMMYLDHKKGDIIIVSSKVQDLWRGSSKGRYGAFTPDHVSVLPIMDSPSNAAFKPFAVRAIYEFSCKWRTFLNFMEGDVILVTNTTNEYWWRGSLDGRDGDFPAHEVKRLTLLTREKRRKVNATHVRAIFNHEASNASELSFRKGDIIILTPTTFKERWTGRLGASIGSFPTSHVIILPPDDKLILNAPSSSAAGPSNPANDGNSWSGGFTINTTQSLETRFPYVHNTDEMGNWKSQNRIPDMPGTQVDNDMGRLCVKILRARKFIPQHWFAECSVSHSGEETFYNTEYRPSDSDVEWQDTFTIDIPSRQSTKLVFRLEWGWTRISPGGFMSPPPQTDSAVLGIFNIQDVPVGQELTYRLQMGLIAVVELTLTFTPCVLPSKTNPKLVGGNGSHWSHVRYVRESAN